MTTAFASLSSLNNPLYLRLFARLNNPDRVKTVSVHLADQTTLVTFRQYLNGVYKHVGGQLDKPDGVKIVQECLLRFAKALWQLMRENCRSQLRSNYSTGSQTNRPLSSGRTQ